MNKNNRVIKYFNRFNQFLGAETNPNFFHKRGDKITINLINYVVIKETILKDSQIIICENIDN